MQRSPRKPPSGPRSQNPLAMSFSRPFRAKHARRPPNNGRTPAGYKTPPRSAPAATAVSFHVPLLDFFCTPGPSDAVAV
jgi:hypothetical protein